MYVHCFGSVLAVKLGQLQLISSLVCKCASDHDRVDKIIVH